MKLFDMPEYDFEQTKFVHTGVHKLMRAKDELFASIQIEEEGDAIPISQNSFESGLVVKNEPVMMESAFIISFEDVRTSSLDLLLTQMDQAADEGLKVIMGFMFETMRKTSDAAGTAMDANGEPFSHELFLRMLDRVEIAFDSEGNPRMPTIVVHPDTMKNIRELPTETSEQIKARELIIERKRQEHYARKRSRKLH